MDINKHNYEAFFLDYHEGNLSPQQVADLLLFIEQHPQYKEEFESFENISLEQTDEKFIHKSSLKHNSNISDELLISSIEGLLSKEESILLKQQLTIDKDLQKVYALYQKTILPTETEIIYPGKAELKRTSITTDDLIISSVEGLLSKSETSLLNQQLSVDTEMRNTLSLYKQTVLVADTSIVYENKEELKKKERRVIPFYYYVAAAAAILLLFGLFYNVTNNSKEKNFAKKDVPSSTFKVQSLANDKVIAPEKEVAVKEVIGHRSLVKKVENNLNIIPKNEIAINNQTLKKDTVVNSLPNIEHQLSTNNNEQPIAINSVSPNIKNQAPTNETKPSQFLSIGQLVATKIKENTLDEKTVAIQKKNGRLKRLTGWDVLQMAARGVSKLTGKKVEVKPTYNDEGDVTAYALGAGGFEFSKGK